MGGHTTTSQLDLKGHHSQNIGTFQDDTVASLRAKGFNQRSLVIVEEISNQAPWHLSRLDALCKAVTRNYHAHFGGALVILVGDLTQLGPVRAGPSLAEAVLDINTPIRNGRRREHINNPTVLPTTNPTEAKYRITHPYTKGANLLTLAKWFELTKQARSKDSSHTEFVQKNYLGERITMNAMKSNGYEILSPNDAQDKL